MVFSRTIKVFSICAIILFIGITIVQASGINFNGQLDYIQLDKGGGVYSGVAIGTKFYGRIDDVDATGFIIDGTTLTSFGCCIAAGGLSVTNDMILSTADATFLNQIIGSQQYNDSDVVDVVDIEGDKTTGSGGRIEIGITYILPANSFDNDDLSNYPVNQDDIELALFFIYEEDNTGQNIYSAGGKIQVPSSPADFDSTSANITNQLLPLKNGDWFKYIGYGAMIGKTENREILGIEIVESVYCLKLVVSDAVEWLAQNIDGNVWFMKVIIDNALTYTRGSGISNPIMPADPQVGDRISSIFPEDAGSYSEITEIGVDVTLNTGLGPYENCVEMTSYWNNEVEEVEYFCPGAGLVKVEKSPGTGMELSEFGNINSEPGPVPVGGGDTGGGGGGCFLSVVSQ